MGWLRELLAYQGYERVMRTANSECYMKDPSESSVM